MPSFLKVCKFVRKFVKLCKNDRTSLRWCKNLVWLSQHTSYCFCRVSKISPMELSCPFCLLSLLICQLCHIKSKSLETFHTSPNHWLFIRKLSLGHAWCTTDKLVDQACTSNILTLSFICLNFWKFANLFESSLKVCKNDRTSLRWCKNLVWLTQHTSYCFCRVSKISPMELSCPFCLVSLLICQLTMLNQNHLKLWSHYRIIGFLLEN